MRPCSCFVCELQRRTDELIAYRIWRAGMPIKWNIAGKAMKARGLMDQISAEYDSFITDGAEHLGDVKDLRSQVGAMKDDLYAAANIMGNSGAVSEPVVHDSVAPETHTRNSNGQVIDR